MTNEEFIELMDSLNYEVEDCGDFFFINPSDDDKALVSIDKYELGSIDTDYPGFKCLSPGEKSQLLYLLVKYSLTPIEEREKQEKFHWRLRRWNIDDKHDEYLNLVSEEGRVTLLSKLHTKAYVTQFTEEEFGEVCVEYGVIPDMFEKEQVE